MKVEILLVANAAAVQDGLLHVQGGGWEHYGVPLFPWTVQGCAAGILTVEPTDLGTSSVVTMDVSDQEGHVAGSHGSMVIVGDRPKTTAGVPVRFPFVFPFSTAISGPAVVKVALSKDGVELAAVAFSVKDPVPDAPPAA